jgi:hypothetical protein
MASCSALLTRAQFEQLADVPPEEEWLANITNLKTRRAYKEDVREFVAFTRADHIQPKTSVKMGGFEAKDCAFAV